MYHQEKEINYDKYIINNNTYNNSWVNNYVHNIRNSIYF